MSAKHTPGKWEVTRQGIGPRSTEDDQSYGMVLPVAYVQNSDFPDQQEANARLIASAPDLLDALERGYAVLADIHNQWPGRLSLTGQGLLVDMRDAIAKAKGLP